MNEHQLTNAIHTWTLKRSNEDLIPLFLRAHGIEDSICRLEGIGNLSGELEAFRLQKTLVRAHIYRILRRD